MKSALKKKPTLEKKTKKIQKAKVPKKALKQPEAPNAEIVQKAPKKLKMNRLALSKKPKTDNGIVYVGHLPYGFDEKGLKEFFSQYGEVVHSRLARSKKTGRSKGYGWVEFPYKEVAKIAADSMNNFVTNGRRLVCSVVEDTTKPIFQGQTDKKFKFINWQAKFRKEKNMRRTPEQRKHHVVKLLKHEEEKRTKIEELNINFKFPGYSALIEKYQKTHNEK